MQQTRLRLFTTGYCTGNNKIVHAGGPAFELKFHAVWALIEHPVLGNILFDTGYSQRFFEVTKQFPYILYKWATPVFSEEENSCVHQLARLNISPGDIDHLVISHFHADHICGLKDFTFSKTWCARKGLEHFLSMGKLRGVSKGYLKPLAPQDLQERAGFPEETLQHFKIGRFDAWQWTEDLSFISLPGHCRGQIGLLVKNTTMGDVLLAADGAWSSAAIREQKYPSRIVSVFIDDYKALKETLDGLHEFHKRFPNVLIVPTHCPEIADKYLSNEA